MVKNILRATSTPRGLFVTRLAAVMIAGAMFIAATVTAMAPRVWGILNSHSQVPPTLTGFSGLAERSYVFDETGAQIGV